MTDNSYAAKHFICIYVPYMQSYDLHFYNIHWCRDIGTLNRDTTYKCDSVSDRCY